MKQILLFFCLLLAYPATSKSGYGVVGMSIQKNLGLRDPVAFRTSFGYEHFFSEAKFFSLEGRAQMGLYLSKQIIADSPGAYYDDSEGFDFFSLFDYNGVSVSFSLSPKFYLHLFEKDEYGNTNGGLFVENELGCLTMFSDLFYPDGAYADSRARFTKLYYAFKVGILWLIGNEGISFWTGVSSLAFSNHQRSHDSLCVARYPWSDHRGIEVGVSFYF